MAANLDYISVRVPQLTLIRLYLEYGASLQTLPSIGTTVLCLDVYSL